MNHCFTKIKRQIVIIHSSLFCSNGDFLQNCYLCRCVGESCKALLIQLGTMKDLKEAYLVGFEWTKSSQPYSVEYKSCNGCSSYQEAQWQGDLPQGFSQEGLLGACQVLIV